MINVVIMRPKHQSQSLFEQVETIAKPHILPTLDIQPIKHSFPEALKTAEMVIVSSANAVFNACEEIITFLQRHPIPIVSMGKGTTAALVERGIFVYFTAPPGSTSESLLEHPMLEKVAEKQIILLGGEGGRSLLGEVLASRGAWVTHVNVYRQSKPIQPITDTLFQWQSTGERYCFVATSANILKNLIDMAGEFLPWLQKQYIMVVGHRMASYAKENGFEYVWVAPSTHSEDIVSMIRGLINHVNA